MSRYREKLNYKPPGPNLEDVLWRNAGIYAHGIRGCGAADLQRLWLVWTVLQEIAME